jgi:putative hydrolase of the HAD superfamily
MIDDELEHIDTRHTLVAIDLDDTLYSEADFLRSLAVSFAPQVECTEEDAYTTMRQAARAGTDAFTALIASISDEERRKSLWKQYSEHTPAIELSPSTRRTLSCLHDDGMHLALITDGKSVTQRIKIRALHLSEFIADPDIIISEEFGSNKLDRRNFQYFCDKYPDISKFFYIGDNPQKDFFWANKLGWTTICISDAGLNTHPQRLEGDRTHLPQVVIDNFFEIYEFIEP